MNLTPDLSYEERESPVFHPLVEEEKKVRLVDEE